MSELSSAIGNSGPKHKLECNGKIYTISLVTQGVKLCYEKALFQRAQDAVAKVKGIVDKDYYERKIDKLIESYNDGDFGMESSLGRKALSKTGGTLLLLSYLMGTVTPDGKDITPLPDTELLSVFAQKPEEVKALFRLVVTESFPGIDLDAAAASLEREGQDSPKATAP